MIKKLPFKLDKDLFSKLYSQIPDFDSRITLNSPTGNFFYDRWEITKDFKNSIWHQALKILPFDVGEARLIKLMPGTAYYSHADIDDRFHLNISGERSFLVDLEKEILYPTFNDGHWYEMNAGKCHSAVNFGNEVRIQIVVRNLLQKNQLKNPIKVKIYLKNLRHDSRYIFDNTISPYLNQLIKMKLVDNFSSSNNQAFFDIEKNYLEKLKNIVPYDFEVKIC